MKKAFKIFLIALSAIIIISGSCVAVFAHPGKTDSSGGHYDRSTGEYHYHHGYPAHQHDNGTCPYDFKNNEKSTEKYYNHISSKLIWSGANMNSSNCRNRNICNNNC